MADGYFPQETSVLRHVHEQRVVGRIYGQHSLLVQATHPLAFTGLTASTNGLGMPFARLTRTATAMERVFFGDKAEVDKLCARVRLMHSRVQGVTTKQAGKWAAGTSYSANDPEFLLWILACIAEGALAVYEDFVGELSGDQRESYWQDYRLVGELFGLDRELSPASFDLFKQYMEERLHSDDLFVTDYARQVATFVSLHVPLPSKKKVALPALRLAVIGSLPQQVRELYGMSWTKSERRRYSMLTATHRQMYPLIPSQIRVGQCAPDFSAIAHEEAKRPEESWPDWVLEARQQYRFAGNEKVQAAIKAANS